MIWKLRFLWNRTESVKSSKKMRSFSLFYIYGSALYQLVGYTICDAIISSSNFFLPLGFFFQYDTRILYETRILSHLDKKPRDKTTQFIYWPCSLTSIATRLMLISNLVQCPILMLFQTGTTLGYKSVALLQAFRGKSFLGTSWVRDNLWDSKYVRKRSSFKLDRRVLRCVF